MVRVNIINPECLADQHLVAEYVEILMLVAHVRKHQEIRAVPEHYCLGKGHMLFFKNKLIYLKKRHELIKKEMKRRGFKANKTLTLAGFNKELLNNWKPCGKDCEIIKKRLVHKIRLKPEYYRYCGEYKPKKFLLGLIKKSKTPP